MTPIPQRAAVPPHPLAWLPNALTIARMALAPAIAAAWLAFAHAQNQNEAGAATSWAVTGAALFLLAGLTDFLDGRLARAWNAQSALGAALDPIADKVLVAVVGLALAFSAEAAPWGAWTVAVPVFVIIARDVAVTALRTRSGFAGVLAVSPLAKWKTAAEIGALALFFAAAVIGRAPGVAEPVYRALLGVGALGLWTAAALSLWTGAAYWRATQSH